MTKHISHLADQSVSIHKTTSWACTFLALFEAISLQPFHSPSKLDSLVTIHTYFKLSFEQSSLWMTIMFVFWLWVTKFWCGSWQGYWWRWRVASGTTTSSASCTHCTPNVRQNVHTIVVFKWKGKLCYVDMTRSKPCRVSFSWVEGQNFFGLKSSSCKLSCF